MTELKTLKLQKRKPLSFWMEKKKKIFICKKCNENKERISLLREWQLTKKGKCKKCHSSDLEEYFLKIHEKGFDYIKYSCYPMDIYKSGFGALMPWNKS